VRRVNFTKGDEKGGDMAEKKFKIVKNFLRDIQIKPLSAA
jgi:hypothetical protein